MRELPKEITKAKKDQTAYAGSARLKTELLKRKALAADDYVFGKIDGVYQSEFKTAWNTLFREANAVLAEKGQAEHRVPLGRKDGFVWHDLRHEFGAQVAERTDDPVVVRDLLRHSSFAMSDRYLKAKEEKLQAVAAALGNSQAIEDENAQNSSAKAG